MKNLGVRWFVYSGAGVECFQGQPGWGTLGCVGNWGDRATVGQWQKVELVTYGQGFWIARVYDQYGNALDVAKILSNSTQIYRATAVTEEAYHQSTDPYMTASFWHSHPKYMIWGSGGGFQDRPASPSPGVKGSHNKLLVSPARPISICPDHYIARLNWGNDPRVWYAGSAGPTPATCYADPIW